MRGLLAFASAAAVALLIAPLVAAQQSHKVARIGVLSGATADEIATVRGLAMFRKELAERGWIEGRNYALIFRFAAGRTDRARELASELSALKPDAILVSGNPLIIAVKQATSAIPIIMINAADPVGTGLVASLARPGGNLTGFSNFPDGMGAKWLEILRESDPGARTIAVLFNPDAPPHLGFLREIESASEAEKLTVAAFPVRNAGDIERAFVAIVEQRIEALVVLPHPATVTHRKQIVTLANRERIAAVYPFREFVDDGGLLAYGSNLADMYRRAADYIDRILRGAKAGELPVQQPTKFDFIVNLRTAKALGLTIPQSILLRADEVIE
jgi:putative ABC transport system substrate-binding protein